MKKKSRDITAIIEAASKKLKQIGTPVARFTHHVISNNLKNFKRKKLKIAPIENITATDLKNLESDVLTKREVTTFPPSRRIINKIESKVVGLCFTNSIYLSSETLDNEALLLRTLVHEINHYVNDTSRKIGMGNDPFTEELRAHLAEDMAISNKQITRGYVRYVANNIAKNYGFEAIENPKMPSGIYDMKDFKALR